MPEAPRRAPLPRTPPLKRSEPAAICRRVGQLAHTEGVLPHPLSLGGNGEGHILSYSRRPGYIVSGARLTERASAGRCCHLVWSRIRDADAYRVVEACIENVHKVGSHGTGLRRRLGDIVVGLGAGDDEIVLLEITAEDISGQIAHQDISAYPVLTGCCRLHGVGVALYLLSVDIDLRALCSVDSGHKHVCREGLTRIEP